MSKNSFKQKQLVVKFNALLNQSRANALQIRLMQIFNDYQIVQYDMKGFEE